MTVVIYTLMKTCMNKDSRVHGRRWRFIFAQPINQNSFQVTIIAKQLTTLIFLLV